MKTTFTYDHYADYAELTTRMVYFSEHYPNYTRLTSLGTVSYTHLDVYKRQAPRPDTAALFPELKLCRFPVPPV